MEVTIVEMTDHVLPNLLEKDMAEIVKREDNGVNVILGEGVEEVVTSSSSSLNSSLKSSKIECVERIHSHNVDIKLTIFSPY
jgi:pyruvate/2-oxoglutarate dehydrogenase complex dihydrolipoamide dehydrogenase (E3) component